ncbi:hypothetical protein E2C01_098397 [Portunus trituberculatus]|uniref:Uncharacterized protein n=1 Tax=Portunus trituberculatus TaxID=210409 RepID=A0A5B7K2W2_PORTR|nr:hypothetical protein [Portunus trituberculatus]
MKIASHKPLTPPALPGLESSLTCPQTPLHLITGRLMTPA